MKPVVERAIADSPLTLLGQLSDKIKPPAGWAQPVFEGTNRVEDLAFFVGINAESKQKGTKILGIYSGPLCREIAAVKAIAEFSSAGRQKFVGIDGCFSIIPNQLIAEAQLFH